ncbi:cell wall hydrolase [Aureimonas flava]|uniref:Cell wall hydrolase n=1 Tax=Aureimonas flava TaxID=2320271 RepID=A0A3A1WGV7_9HYPH|nr:cell wall hydrolase [Aureimonas flava]RIX98828.1 cell wall hydrolase [Aureimonas flava]
MTKPKRGARRGARTSAARRAVLRRLVLSLATTLLVLPALPTALSNTGSSTPDPSSNLAAPLLTLSAFAGEPAFDDAEADLAMLPADGAVYVRDGSRRIPAERGGRVGPHPLAAVQPRFAAGAILSPNGLLRPGLALGDDEMRTALAGPMPADATRVAAFRRMGDDVRLPSADMAVEVASLAPAAVAREIPAGKAEALQALAAYAPEAAPGNSSLFDAVLHPTGRDFRPPIGADDHSWAASTLPASSFTEKEQTCLAKGIYFEARGESEKGQAAVAQVILNRVRNPAYPETICGVVYQNQDWKNRCQFSFACDGIKDVIWNKRAYGTAKRIAGEVTRGETWLPEVGSATHYHATYVSPRWARTMQKVDKIGLHVFYRTFGGGWR